MQKVFKLKRTRIIAMLLAVLTVLPLTAAFSPAQAKPPRHAPAWGYRRKHTEWRRTTWRRTTYRPVYHRRYRTQYRIWRDRYGHLHRTAYRVYY